MSKTKGLLVKDSHILEPLFDSKPSQNFAKTFMKRVSYLLTKKVKIYF